MFSAPLVRITCIWILFVGKVLQLLSILNLAILKKPIRRVVLCSDCFFALLLCPLDFCYIYNLGVWKGRKKAISTLSGMAEVRGSDV